MSRASSERAAAVVVAVGTMSAFIRAPGTDFTSQTLTDSPQEPKFPALAAARSGAVALAWTETPPPPDSEGQPGTAVVKVSRGTRGGPLSPATQLSDPGDDASWPTVAIDDSGETLVAWIKGGFGSGPIRATVGAGVPSAQSRTMTLRDLVAVAPARVRPQAAQQ
jgi:hypothetical protein